ncbi:MAG: glycosyl hydrolase family 28-related protein, partial [Planctomycetota bacterium]
CGRGVVFVSFNDYNYTFDGCEFRRCGTAIHCSHGNFYARNCHFEGSTGADIESRPEHASSVRRCTSLGSRAFIRHANSVSPLIVQDCQVGGWTDPNGAITVSGAPVTIFDCVFRGGPAGTAPIRVGQPGQRLIASVNRVEGGGDVIRAGHRGRVYDVPAGERSGVLTSARQRFLTDEVRIPGKVFDAKRAFGARGDGRTDDAAAIQRAIDAARAHGRGAIAYLPTGSYAVGKTLHITGRDYFIGGTGFQTRLIWKGAAGGTMVEIRDPLNVSLENIAVGNHDSGAMSNAVDILQTGSGRTTRMTYDWVFVYGMYQKKPFRKGLHLRGLGTNDTVLMRHVQGNLRIIDSARATILANCTYEGSVVVEGRDPRRDGFLGFLTRLSTITRHGLYLKDNHSIVISDFYVEQADDGFVLEGSPDLPAGRATIQGPKVDFSSGKGDHEGTVLDIRNYGGQVFSGPNQFYASLPRVPIRHKGERKLELFLWGSCFYKTHLEVTKDPALTLYLLGNSGVDMTAKRKDLTPEGRAEDNMARDELAPLAMALDDLRRLGEFDLRLTHPRVRLPHE